MECKQCGAEYESKRATSQYCSGPCRVKASRLSVTPERKVSVTELSVTRNPLASVKGMSDDELIRRLHYIKDWKQSPEHKERLRRRAEHGQINSRAAGA